jgi:hypothetical protein
MIYREKMKSLLLIFGSIGLVVSAPIAYYGYGMFKGFGGVLTAIDALILFSPFCFGLTLLVGLVWPKEKKES